MHHLDLRYIAALLLAMVILCYSFYAGAPAIPKAALVLTGNTSGLFLKELAGKSSIRPVYTRETASLAPFFFDPIYVNLADRDLLQTLPGIGPGLSGNIVTNREVFGPFKSPADLKRVPGIGEKRAAAYSEHLSFLQ